MRGAGARAIRVRGMRQAEEGLSSPRPAPPRSFLLLPVQGAGLPPQDLDLVPDPPDLVFDGLILQVIAGSAQRPVGPPEGRGGRRLLVAPALLPTDPGQDPVRHLLVQEHDVPLGLGLGPHELLELLLEALGHARHYVDGEVVPL
jgi:hypothetical protein